MRDWVVRWGFRDRGSFRNKVSPIREGSTLKREDLDLLPS
jgi:hypothetical protein